MDNEPEPTNLSYDQKDLIGEGGSARVYSGFFNSLRPVAIKRLQRNHRDDESTILQGEIKNMQKAGDHDYILKFIHYEMDENFIYIATELCRGTLEDYFNGKYKGPKFTSEKEMLLQVTKGLAHLHEKGLVHRDIKPTNILVFVPEGKDSDPVIKLADFGDSKTLNPGKEDYTNTSVTNPKGTRGWMAPEVYHRPERFNSKVDIFPLGLIFAYTLSKGNKHPFGDDTDLRIASIKKMESMTMVQQDLKEPYSDDNITFELIKSMLNITPDDRPAVGKIVDSTFFTAPLLRNGQDLNLTLLRLDTDGEVAVHGQHYENLPEGSVHQRRQTTKDMNELLSDGDLSDKEKDAIRRKDLNWICEYMKNNLFQILTLMLAENGVDLNARDEYERTPILHLCRVYNKEDLPKILELLINKGAKVKAVDKYRRTMLHLVCYCYSHRNLKDIIDLLIKKGVPVDAKDDYERTVLHYLAIHYKHDNMKDIIDLLIEAGVSVDAKTEWRDTALHYLAEYYNHDDLEEIVRLLIDKGARLDVKNDDGLTPFLELCGNNYILKHIRVFSLLTPTARDGPLRSHTKSVTRLLEEFNKKKISSEELENGLGKIRWNAEKKWSKRK